MAERVLKKVCLLGDGAIGKTSLIRRFVFDQFDDRYIMTFGTKVVKKTLTMKKDSRDLEVTLMIWDILGQRMHDPLHAAYYQGASGALIGFDITRKETFDNMREWVAAFRKASPNSHLLFFANKSDLPNWAVTEEQFNDLAKEFGAPRMLTSAKIGKNVEESFAEIARMMC